MELSGGEYAVRRRQFTITTPFLFFLRQLSQRTTFQRTHARVQGLAYLAYRRILVACHTGINFSTCSTALYVYA